jgi:Ca-activated chloride channel family protein
MIVRTAFLFLLGVSTAFAQATLEAPATAKAGGQVTVTVAGKTTPRDFVTIVPKGMREGGYDAYQYTSKPGALNLVVPAAAGEYEIRLLGAASPYPTLAKRSLTVEAVTATLDAPAQVTAGKQFDVKWTGPNNERDYVAIGDVDPKGRKYITYKYTREGSPLKLNAPDDAREYELRYILATGDTIIARKRIVVGSVSASVTAPASVAAGAKFPVTWKGPNNPRDFITIVKVGTADKQYGWYEYTSKGSPLELRAPDVAAEYEVRYLTAQSYATLGVAKLTVTATPARCQGPRKPRLAPALRSAGRARTIRTITSISCRRAREMVTAATMRTRRAAIRSRYSRR